MDQETFQKKIFIYKDKLFRFAKRILIEQDEAFDAVQNVLVRLWQMRDRLMQYQNLEAFCMQCVKNEALNRIKKNRVRMDFEESYVATGVVEQYVGNTKEIIVSMINALPEKQRLVMHLRDIEEYEVAEIQEILEMNESAVRINLMRARQKVKEQLVKLFDDEKRRIEKDKR